jgi:protein phosphatase
MAIIPAPPAEIVSPSPLAVADAETLIVSTLIETDLATSSQALLNLSLNEEATTPISPSKGKSWVLFVVFLLLLMGSTSVGLFAWWELYPQSFQQVCRQLPEKVRKFCPE